MCYVIITGRSLAWLLLSLVAFMLILTGIMTPKWLLGQPVVLNENNTTKFYVPSVGIYNRCIRMRHDHYNCAPFSLYGLATDSAVYPKPWKAALFFLSLCAAIQFSTVLAGVMACCVQSVFKKSVISLAGATQALGGLFGVLGLLLYPWGWGAPRVKRMCGDYSEPYLPGECSIGWALFVTATGVAQVFIASALSKPADKAANSDKDSKTSGLDCVLINQAVRNTTGCTSLLNSSFSWSHFQYLRLSLWKLPPARKAVLLSRAGEKFNNHF